MYAIRSYYAPPASARSRQPVSACAWRAVRSMISSVTSWIDAAMSISRWVMGVSGWRAGPPKSRITSYNVCYTKLLRGRHGQGGAAPAGTGTRLTITEQGTVRNNFV